jgi:hypothetical protein
VYPFSSKFQQATAGRSQFFCWSETTNNPSRRGPGVIAHKEPPPPHLITSSPSSTRQHHATPADRRVLRPPPAHPYPSMHSLPARRRLGTRGSRTHCAPRLAAPARRLWPCPFQAAKQPPLYNGGGIVIVHTALAIIRKLSQTRKTTLSYY